MIDNLIELAVNLVQSLMFVGFLFFFFERRFDKKRQIFGLVLFTLLEFAAVTYFSLIYSNNYFIFSDMLIYILLLEFYAIIFLKGNIFGRLIMPVIAFSINTIISYLFAYTVSFFTGESYYELASESTLYRYICIILISATNYLVFFILLKVKSKNFSITRWTDVASFIVIPMITMVIIYATFYVLSLTGYRSDILPFLTVIVACMIAVAVIVWLMMTRISKDNEIKTKLLLTQQRERLYEANVLNINKQIGSMSKIKHDMKNNLLCVSELIAQNKPDEAQSFCREITQGLEKLYTPVNTENPILNAVINVELEKASTLNIPFSVTVNDELPELSHNSDLVSIIGNLCDNAVEYLQTIDEDKRIMKLEISRHNSYCIINCKNRITSSVLKENPELLTEKNDKSEHGKGLEILRANAEKYDGNLEIDEKGDFFSVSVILKIPSLPEIN